MDYKKTLGVIKKHIENKEYDLSYFEDGYTLCRGWLEEDLKRGLRALPEMFNPDMALAIVVNPNTGEILGMGSLPDFDPNNYKEYGTSVLNRNLPIWSSYEPGSTFKVVTMSSAVEEGVIDIFNDHFYDAGKVNVDGSVLKCWKSGGHILYNY